MSVINRVLQDLEARKAAPGSASPVGVRPAAKGGTDVRRLGLIVAVGLAAIVAVGFGELPSWLGGAKPHLPAPVGMGAGETATAPQASPAAAPPATAIASAPVTVVATASPDAAASSPATVATAQPGTAKAAPAKPASPVPSAPAAGPLAAPMAAATPKAVDAPAAKTAPPPAAAEDAAASAPTIEKQMRAATPAQRAQLSYRAAVELASSGHNSQAIERALEAVKADPSLGDARQFAAALLSEAGRYDEAAALARDGLARNANQPPLVYLLARLAAERGDAEEALNLLNRAPSLNADGFGLRGGLLSQRGDFKHASQDYQAALRQQPGNGLWWLGLGVALEADGQPEQARQVYARAQALGLDQGELGAFLDQKLRRN